jgi:hypothetical protein
MKTVIIGFGTGRCGTHSLAKILDNQHDAEVTHERIALGWDYCHRNPSFSFRTLFEREAKFVGDVGFGWIKYLWLSMERFPTKAICMLRPDEEVIESFWNYKKDGTYCGTPSWFSYPFDSTTMTKDDLARSIAKYRLLENAVRKAYPGQIHFMEMTSLNDEAKLAELLIWIGFDPNNLVLKPEHLSKQEEVVARMIDPERSIRPSFVDKPEDVSEE